ncbi:MAG: alpha/beta hydrolase [Bacteroidota bacterium]
MGPSSFNLVALPGLGFTEALFAPLQEIGWDCEVLNWQEPQPGEKLPAYAKRMGEDVLPPGGKLVLLGHSFGGILAQEISHFRKLESIILVSSVKKRTEIPWNLRAVAPLGLHHLFSRSFCLNTFPLWGPGFGYDTPASQSVFKEMVSRQTDTILQWSLRELSRWRPPAPPACPVFQVHGDRDKTFPYSRIKDANHSLPGGDHMMVFKQPAAFARILQTYLDTLSSSAAT